MSKCGPQGCVRHEEILSINKGIFAPVLLELLQAPKDSEKDGSDEVSDEDSNANEHTGSEE